MAMASLTQEQLQGQQKNQPRPKKARRSIFRGEFLAYLLVSPPIVLVVLLIFFPSVQSFIHTLVSDTPGTEGQISLARYINFFQDPVARENLGFTINITLITVAALFVFCFPLSLYLRFSKSRISGWVQSLALFPIFVPGIILAYAMIQFLGPRGTLESILKIFGITGYQTPWLHWEGIVIALVWESIPFTVLVLTGGLGQVNNELIECARDVGASDWQIFWRIILPLIQRPAMIAFSLNFIGIFGSYTLPYLLGPAAPQMMGVLMQHTFSGYRETRNAETQAVITFLVSLVVGLLYVRTVARKPSERG